MWLRGRVGDERDSKNQKPAQGLFYELTQLQREGNL